MRWNLQPTRLLGSLVLLLSFVWSGVALAAVNPGGTDPYSVPLRQFDLYNTHSPATAQAEEQAMNALSNALGGVWKVYSWNPQTNTPSNFYGSGAVVASALNTPQDVLTAARRVMQAAPQAFRANPADLRFDSAPRGLGKWTVLFQQTYHMVDVWQGGVRLTFTDQGRFFAAGSNIYSGIKVDPTPSISASVAQEIARRDLPFNESVDSVDPETKLLILPVPQSESDLTYHLVWRVKVRTQDPVGLWVTHVDAHSGEIVWRYNDVSFVNYVGTTSAPIERPSYCEAPTVETLPYLRVTIAGVGTTYADQTGAWSMLYAGTDPRTVTADLYGQYVDVNNISGAQASFTGTATPGVPLTVSFTDANAQKDERDVYQAVGDIHNFFQTFAPEFAYPTQRITANVSRASTCNAYWNGTINFYMAGGGCANTGQIMGVVYHEYGHGIQNAILGWQGDQGLGEGNGDINANLLTLESIIGRGFYLNQCTGGIRDSHNSLHYPQDVIGAEIHDAGRVIAGFHWDAMQALIGVYGVQEGRLITARTWHYGRVLLHPTTQPDQVFATFVADDNDGDLTNGTPHYDAFCLGASNHGFSCPEILSGVLITHTPLTTRVQEGDAAVVAIIRSTLAPLVAESLRVNYRINGGGFVSALLTPTGNPDEFSGTIPSLVRPSEVEYYLRARDQAGNTRNSPALAPAVLNAFDVATVYDNLETPSGWTVNAEGTDNATTGIWVEADPVGTIAQPEDDHTPSPGVVCWVTGNANPGDPDGTNDVDGGTTTLYSPTYDLTGAGAARAKYWRWYSNDLGGAPGLDSWVVQVRNNGGGWVDVENTMASSNGWVSVNFDLAAAFGAGLGTVQFKFVASDLGAGSLIEAAVDDFEILSSAVDPTAAPQDDQRPLRFALSSGQPNPAPGATRIGFEVPGPALVRLGVYDVAGRLVRVLADRSFTAGRHVAEWDGRDTRGRTAPSGVYYYRMQAGTFDATRTLILTR